MEKHCDGDRHDEKERRDKHTTTVESRLRTEARCLGEKRESPEAKVIKPGTWALVRRIVLHRTAESEEIIQASGPCRKCENDGAYTCEGNDQFEYRFHY